MSVNVDGFLRLSEVEVERRRVFVRADLDCPLDESGALADDAKVRAALPTLKHLLEREARVVVGAHASAANRTADSPPPSLEPCAAKLAELLETEVYLPDDCTGLLTQKLISELRPGRVVLLENLLGDPREAAGDPGFARELARDVEVLVGDCLAGPHHLASLKELPRLVRERAIGAALERELMAANRLRHEWGPGFVLVVRGHFAPYRSLLNFAAARPGITIVPLGPLARMLTERPEDLAEPSDLDPAETIEACSWAQKARSRSVTVELGLGSDAIDRIETALGRAKATLLVGVRPVDATSRAVLSAAPLGDGALVSVDGAGEDILTLLDHSGPSKACFVSTAGQSFLSVLCEQKLAGVEALRRVG